MRRQQTGLLGINLDEIQISHRPWNEDGFAATRGAGSAAIAMDVKTQETDVASANSAWWKRICLRDSHGVLDRKQETNAVASYAWFIAETEQTRRMTGERRRGEIL